MKILHVFDFFSPGYGGGVVTFVYQVSKALARREHEIVIYTSDFKLNKEYIDSLYGSKVYPFHNWFSSSNIYLMPGIIREAKGELRDFDIIHLHCLRSLQNIVIHTYAKK
ncbi:MAG: glycosyltransferase, partial [Dehalococcoidia bacterium]|nr:glycosyltransferase [Dehalococcoidia bacterium]